MEMPGVESHILPIKVNFTSRNMFSAKYQCVY